MVYGDMLLKSFSCTELKFNLYIISLYTAAAILTVAVCFILALTTTAFFRTSAVPLPAMLH